MKTHIRTYSIAALLCTSIMLLIDFLLGSEAEFLNAWLILNRLLGNEIAIQDSLVVTTVGLYPAALIVLLLNSCLGILLVQIQRKIQFIFKGELL
ncbi:MAG: hypothetical protein KDD94_09320 [Calditrichaeota bacterium]|nr:hypothetical protein [Calditrichota bacterium]